MAIKKVVVLKVGIYIYISQKGKFKGTGKAAALLEFIDGKGVVHTRITKAAEKDCTRNGLTLAVTVTALKMLAKPCEVTIHTDNSYMKSCVMYGWLNGWQQKGWKKADGNKPANLELWKDFYISMQMHGIKFAPYEDRQEFNIISKEVDYGQNS